MTTRTFHPDKSVAAQAAKIVHSDRNKTYGHPLTGYTTAAKIMTAIIGQTITPYQAALCMIGLKLSRASRSIRRDNLVDIAGYAEVANEIILAQLEEGWDHREIVNADPVV